MYFIMQNSRSLKEAFDLYNCDDQLCLHSKREGISGAHPTIRCPNTNRISSAITANLMLPATHPIDKFLELPLPLPVYQTHFTNL